VSDYEEKRNFQRMVIDSVLSFSLKGGSKSYDGNVINLSSKGIFVYYNRDYQRRF
jgi:hypothetical protein